MPVKIKNLDPKIVVTANLDGLTKPQFVVKTGGIAQSAIDNSSIAPTTLDPTPADLQIEVQNMASLMVKRETIMQELKNNTEQTNKSQKTITGYIVNGWIPEIQKKVTNPEDIKLLGLGIKGVDDGHGGTGANIANSKPVFVSVEVKSLEHVITFRNSKTGNIALPEDVKDLLVYEFIGDSEPPSDLKKWSYLGTAKRGKFTNHFTSDMIGKNIWYVAVYVGRPSATLDSSELSAKVKSSVM